MKLAGIAAAPAAMSPARLSKSNSTSSPTVLAKSLLAVDGQFLCLGELGHLLWLDLTPKGYKELSRARLFYARES